jgi:hypothetical protein
MRCGKSTRVKWRGGDNGGRGTMGKMCGCHKAELSPSLAPNANVFLVCGATHAPISEFTSGNAYTRLPSTWFCEQFCDRSSILRKHSKARADGLAWLLFSKGVMAFRCLVPISYPPSFNHWYKKYLEYDKTIPAKSCGGGLERSIASRSARTSNTGSELLHECDEGRYFHIDSRQN